LTGDFKGSAPGYILELIQLDPPEAEEHLKLEKNFFLMVVKDTNQELKKLFDW